MADNNNVIANQFTGLPMASLIGGPLQAAAEAQLKLARVTKDFIETVGFDVDNNNKKNIRVVEFGYKKLEKRANKDGEYKDTPIDMKLTVPFLSIVKVPSLFIDTVDITFDMEVKTSEEIKSSNDSSTETTVHGRAGWWIFSARTDIKGCVSSHKENTRKTDTSAKYNVRVHASDHGMPEGLARVFDILNEVIIPVEEEATKDTKATTNTSTQDNTQTS